MVVNEVLEVIADDPAAEMDIKSLVKRTGNTILKVEKENDVLRVIIKKTKE
jgi:TusA-related sulfurtransferase